MGADACSTSLQGSFTQMKEYGGEPGVLASSLALSFLMPDEHGEKACPEKERYSVPP